MSLPFLLFRVLRAETDQPVGGSRGFVRDVAIRIPRPSRTTTPTRIHVGGTFNRYAAIPSPMIRIMKPTRYVPNDDMDVSGRVNRMHEQAAYPVNRNWGRRARDWGLGRSDRGRLRGGRLSLNARRE